MALSIQYVEEQFLLQPEYRKQFLHLFLIFLYIYYIVITYLYASLVQFISEDIHTSSNNKLQIHYTRAKRCGGDIVTLLWFRECVCVSLRPCLDLVNTIETKPLCASLSNLADMFTMMRG